MLSGDRPKHLLALVSCAGILALISFALWPVFLTKLGQEWGLTNTDIGWISGAYFFGYLIATPVLVGLTDRVDARLVFPWRLRLQFGRMPFIRHNRGQFLVGGHGMDVGWSRLGWNLYAGPTNIKCTSR